MLSDQLQVYSAQQLKEILQQCDIDGSGFHEKRTERILTIAEK